MTCKDNRSWHFPHKAISLIMVIVLVLAVLTGCNSNSTTSTGAPSASGTSASGTSAANNSSTTTKGSAAPSKNTLVVATSQEPTVFFNQDQKYQSSQAKDGPVNLQIYEALLWLDEKGQVQPWLAKDYKVSDDGLKYTFTIRDDVYFHNGKKMTAEDVAFTFKLCLEKNQQQITNLLINLKAAEVVDSTHVALTLSAPFAAFPNAVTSRAGFIICKSYYEEVGSEGYNTKPIGTGAYKFVSRVSGSEVSLEAFDKYWGGVPSIKTIKIKPITNVSTQFISLESGNVDVIINADVNSAEKIPGNAAVTWAKANSATRSTLSFNTFTGNLSKNINIRRAIQSVIDKEELLLGVLAGHGTILEIDAVPGYLGAPTKGMYKTVTKDLNKAKEYLTAAKYDGSELKCIVLAGTKDEKAAQIIQGQLLAVGIKMQVVPADTSTYYGYVMGGQSYDISIVSTTSSLYDISSINTNYHSNTLQPEKVYPEKAQLDSLIEKANSTLNNEQRKAYAAEVLDIVTEQAYAVPLYSPVSAIAYNKSLKGVLPHPQAAFRAKDWTW